MGESLFGFLPILFEVYMCKCNEFLITPFIYVETHSLSQNHHSIQKYTVRTHTQPLVPSGTAGYLHCTQSAVILLYLLRLNYQFLAGFDPGVSIGLFKGPSELKISLSPMCDLFELYFLKGHILFAQCMGMRSYNL